MSGRHGEPKILVVGATGKQGQSLVNALDGLSFRVLALTRNPNGAKALALKNKPYVDVVKGNLDNKDSMRHVFVNAGGKGAVWGVFMALAYAGLGESSEGEAVQGITLADLAMQFGVSVFVYSSVHRGETDDDSDRVLSEHSGKIKIERHIHSLGEQGLQWTILRPVFFMENYEGSVGKATTAVLRVGLKKDVKIRLVTVEDVGRVAAAIFQRPVNVAYKTMIVAGDDLTVSEQDATYHRITGKHLPAFPNFIGSFVVAINSGTRELLSYIEYIYRRRADNTELFEEHLANARAVYPNMITFEEWAEQHRNLRKKDDNRSWNRVSLIKLLTGRL